MKNKCLRLNIRCFSRLRILLPVLLALPCLFAASSPADKAVYVVGYEYDGRTSTPCYWLNGVKHSLPVTTGPSGEAAGIAISPSGVYIAGYEYGENPKTPRYWRVGVQYSLSIAAEAWASGEARAVAVSPSGVYIAGYDGRGIRRAPCYWRNGVQYLLPVTARLEGFAFAIALR
jgi:hypothetical protein